MKYCSNVAPNAKKLSAQLCSKCKIVLQSRRSVQKLLSAIGKGLIVSGLNRILIMFWLPKIYAILATKWRQKDRGKRSQRQGIRGERPLGTRLLAIENVLDNLQSPDTTISVIRPPSVFLVVSESCQYTLPLWHCLFDNLTKRDKGLIRSHV